MNYEKMLGTVFYLLSLIAILVFTGGLIGLIRLWRLGKHQTPHKISTSKCLKSLLKGTFLQPQILEYSAVAWFSHMLIFYGFVALFLLTSFEAVISRLIAPQSELAMAYFTTGTGALIWAFWGDMAGLAILAGILIALIRRYIFPPKTLNTISDDAVAIWFLFVVVVSGWFCEVVRIALRPESHDAASSFVISWILPFLNGYSFSEIFLKWAFWIHGIAGLIFVAYIPMSKFKHILSSPLVYSFVTAEDSYTKEKWLKKERKENYAD